jgi:hypothetical protein
VDVPHALAILSLTPGATERQIARQYKKLVKLWHPDRFANDPKGVAEATDRLRLIIQAFETLQLGRAGSSTSRPDADSKGASSFDGSVQQLTRKQLDDIIDAIGHRESFIDQLKADPWNRASFLVVAVVEFALSLSVTSHVEEPWPARVGYLPLISAIVSVAFATAIWSSSRGARVFGWCGYLLLTVGLPLFAIVFAGADLGSP